MHSKQVKKIFATWVNISVNKIRINWKPLNYGEFSRNGIINIRIIFSDSSGQNTHPERRRFYISNTDSIHS